ncbi:MAG: hypothetical protein OEY14_15160 [Myxococcales bacterium]|nr:hypothetical protein [Myxococcales bacterium]
MRSLDVVCADTETCVRACPPAPSAAPPPAPAMRRWDRIGDGEWDRIGDGQGTKTREVARLLVFD